MAQTLTTRTISAHTGACAIGATIESATMSTSLTISTGVFSPAINKAGKVTASAEKVALSLNALSDRALLGAALTAKGAMGKQARAHVAAQAVTAESLLSLPMLDGGQWGDLFALLRGVYGVADFNRATQRGRSGCVAYMQAVRVTMVQRFDRAETAKAQESAYKALQAFDVDMGRVVALNDVAERAAQAARALETASMGDTGAAADTMADVVADVAQALADAGLTEETTEATTEALPVIEAA